MVLRDGVNDPVLDYQQARRRYQVGGVEGGCREEKEGRERAREKEGEQCL